jgi:hypothetical protein
MIDIGLPRLWPPMKVGVGTNHFRHRLQRETALGLDRLQSFEILKVAIGERFIGQRPQALCRLQLWGLRRQQGEVHPGGELYLWAHMPARPVAHQEDLFAPPGAHGLGEFGEGYREGHDRDGGQQQPERPARRGVHKGIQITPLVPMLDYRGGTLPPAAPHPPPDGFES